MSASISKDNRVFEEYACISFIQNSVFINLENRYVNSSLVGTSNLAVMITSAFPYVLFAVFPKKSGLNGEKMCDTLRAEWRLYQAESIPESAYQPFVESKVSRSYVKRATNM